MTLTYDKMRNDVARALDLSPESIDRDTNLYDLGLDSMRLMSLALDWEAEGHAVDFSLLMEGQTLAAWAAALGLEQG